MGDGWAHVAVRVDDRDEAWDDLMTREVDDYRDPASCDHNYAFTKDQDGHEVELVTRN